MMEENIISLDCECSNISTLLNEDLEDASHYVVMTVRFQKTTQGQTGRTQIELMSLGDLQQKLLSLKINTKKIVQVIGPINRTTATTILHYWQKDARGVIHKCAKGAVLAKELHIPCYVAFDCILGPNFEKKVKLKTPFH
jgi:hypothetical protein